MRAEVRDDARLSPCEPGPIANQTTLSRLSAFDAQERDRELIYTPPRKRRVRQLSYNSDVVLEGIPEAVGSTKEDMRTLTLKDF
jgi:hypothetical protein